MSSGDPARIKDLYKQLGADWWEAQGGKLGEIPVLSLPETAPLVCACLDGVSGLVLDAGCGPNPAVSIRLAGPGGSRAGGSGAGGSARWVVSLDIGWGTVRVARSIAAAEGAVLLGVVGDVEYLPFRDGAFDGVVCDDTIEHLPDEDAGVRELARVSRAGGTVVLATPNRHNVAILRRRAVDLLRRRGRPASDYFVSTSHLREHTWAEAEALVEGRFEVVGRTAVGWSGPGARRAATRVVELPGLFRLGQMVVLSLRPRPRRQWSAE
ncbi:MAG: class I SAM-dependent methyltransferase [Acidimicrobiales bacterium]